MSRAPRPLGSNGGSPSQLWSLQSAPLPSLTLTLSFCAFNRFAPNALCRLLFLCRLVDCGLHPYASLLKFRLLLLRQILPLFELLKCIFGVGALLSGAIPGCVFGSDCITNFERSLSLVSHRCLHQCSVATRVIPRLKSSKNPAHASLGASRPRSRMRDFTSSTNSQAR